MFVVLFRSLFTNSSSNIVRKNSKSFNSCTFVMSSSKVDQKEYLKRYLSAGGGDSSKKKKKRKEKEIRGKSITIIDTDLDVGRLEKIQDDDLEVFQTGEDAPQVVGVIDDRPPELRALDFKNSTRWKVISDDNGFESDLIVQEMDADGRIRKNGKKPDSKKKSVSFGGTQDDDGSSSPPRRNRSPDLSPVRKRQGSQAVERRNRGDSDESPPRIKRRDSDASPPRRQRKDSDASPPRKKRSSLDESPPRRGKKADSGDDLSPIRKREKGSSDRSPPRRSRRSPSPLRRPRERSQSPARRQRRTSEDRSPPRRPQNSSRDLSPPRRRQRSPERRDRSPDDKRRGRKRWDSPDKDRRRPLPPKNGSQDSSPPRRRQRDSSASPGPSGKKMERTLDGKMAGLQSAKALRVESEKFREREKKTFDAMSMEMSGRDAQVVRRDRKTGRIRDMEAEMERERIKDAKEAEKKAIYDRWGKGVKQVDDHMRKREEEAHEMNKPLARYAGDNDLEDYLRNQERDGDPMLAYIREKEREKKRGTGQLVVMPMYQGSYPINRFGIAPGYRWDGVDRSSGYEKKYFEVQSRKKASEEEAYRYSTEDM